MVVDRVEVRLAARESMKPSEGLLRACDDLAQVVKQVEHGLPPKLKRVRRVDLAAKHLDEWCDVRGPSSGERGGSSSPVEQEDRAEDQRLRVQVLRDRDRLVVLVRRLEQDARELASLVTRNVETVDAGKLPSVVAGCRSCARRWLVKGQVLSEGHWAPVHVQGAGLCRWCWRYAKASSNGGPVNESGWPPVEACAIMHEHGPAKASRWLTKHGA